MSIIKAGTTVQTGFVVTSDDSGTLQIKTGSNQLIALDITSDQIVKVSDVAKFMIPGGVSGQVLSTNGAGLLSWVNGSDGSSEVTVRQYKFIATNLQTTFSGDDVDGRILYYTNQNILVFVNGEYTTNYTATTGSSIVFSVGKPTGTVIDIVSYEPFKKIDIVPASTGGHFNGSVSVRGTITTTGKFIGDASQLTNLTNSQIVTALGYVPYNATNPNSYTTLSEVGLTGTAAKLTTGRTIAMTGDVTWTTMPFDGSSGVSSPGTLSNTGVVAGTYKSVTVDSKGRVSDGSNPTTLSGYGITDSQPLNSDLTSITNIPHYGAGLLKKVASGNWQLDTNNYITNVAEALGYIPYNSSNPNNFLTQATATPLYATKGELSTSIPAGVIVMWRGTTAPSGWAICNGSNGTPDLRDRFVMGATGSYGVGSVGGFADSTLPSHNHSLTGTATGPAGEHQHDSSFGEAWPSYAPFGVSGRYGAGSRGGIDWDNYGYLTNWAGGHSHNINGTVGYSGSAVSGRNIPPFYALAYIMKL